MVAHELALPFYDIAADNHGLDIRGACAQDHRRNTVAVTVEMRRPHIDHRDVSLLSGRKAPDLMLHIPHASAVDRREAQHVSLVERDRWNLLSACKRWGVRP